MELLLLHTVLELVLRLLVMLYLTLELQLMVLPLMAALLVTHSLLMEAQSTTLSEPNLLV